MSYNSTYEIKSYEKVEKCENIIIIRVSNRKSSIIGISAWGANKSD